MGILILSSNLKRVLSGRELSHSQKYNEWRKFAFFISLWSVVCKLQRFPYIELKGKREKTSQHCVMRRTVPILQICSIVKHSNMNKCMNKYRTMGPQDQ